MHYFSRTKNLVNVKHMHADTLTPCLQNYTWLYGFLEDPLGLVLSQRNCELSNDISFIRDHRLIEDHIKFMKINRTEFHEFHLFLWSKILVYFLLHFCAWSMVLLMAKDKCWTVATFSYLSKVSYEISCHSYMFLFKHLNAHRTNYQGCGRQFGMMEANLSINVFLWFVCCWAAWEAILICLGITR